MTEKAPKKKAGRVISLLAFMTLLAVLAVVYVQSGDLAEQPLPLPPVETEPDAGDEGEQMAPVVQPPQDLSGQKLVITAQRQRYQSGELRLVIPRLDIDAAVWSGTSSSDLRHGACLYDYAQLPGEDDSNVSIAAHRNGRVDGQVTEAMFYYIDRLTEGDYLYLRDSGHIYRYLYESTAVVEADDWSPILPQGYSCLTLTSCEPIGISTHRIIVRGRLEAVTPVSADYDYYASEKDEQYEGKAYLLEAMERINTYHRIAPEFDDAPVGQ